MSLIKSITPHMLPVGRSFRLKSQVLALLFKLEWTYPKSNNIRYLVCWNVSNISRVARGRERPSYFLIRQSAGDLCKTHRLSPGPIQRHFSVYPLFVWKLTRIKASNYQRQIPVSPEPGPPLPPFLSHSELIFRSRPAGAGSGHRHPRTYELLSFHTS